MSVVAGLETLEGRAGRPARMGDGEVLAGAAVRRLACDASISRVITGPRGEPLDVGRSTPVVPAGMRRALEVRDGGCTFPGCDRPPDWTDSHHLVHWIDGGETRIENLTLLCRRHHTLHHERGFRVVRRSTRAPAWVPTRRHRDQRLGSSAPASASFV